MKSNKLKNFGVRADAIKIRTAKKLGISISDVFRQVLDQEIFKHKNKVCPTCGDKKK